LANIPTPDGGPTFYGLLKTAYDADPFPSEFLWMLQDGTCYFKQITLGEYEQQNDKLYYRKKLFC
jgi:hypothetical protein